MGSKLRICKFYNVATVGESACRNPKCPHLHICKHYVYGQCKFGVGCKRSHDILTMKVQLILKTHGIDTQRKPKDILNTLRSTLPNQSERRESVDSIPPSASWMRPSVKGTLSRSASVRSLSNENARPSVKGTLSRSASVRSLSNENARPSVKGTLSRSASVRSLSNENATEASPQQIVCMFFLKGFCGYGENCYNYHCDMPYQWLYNHPGANRDDSWSAVDEEEYLNLELQYSDPAQTGSDLHVGNSTVSLNFNTMEGKDGDRTLAFKRLSTETSAVLDTQPLATNWIWYWQAPDGNWKKYGEAIDGQKATITNKEIELAFVANPKGQLKFVAKGNITHEYTIDFTSMKQINRKSNTERDVARRPEFVRRVDFEHRLVQPRIHVGMVGSQSTGDISTVTAPSSWLLHELPGVELLDHSVEVKLDSTTAEYKQTENLFKDKLSLKCGQLTIKSIHRIENGDLWYNYQSKKLKMKKQNNGNDVEERQLFHGTQTQYVNVICKQGFDFRLNGKSSGTAYGKGSYFATTSKYSHDYTGSDSKYRKMFIAKVLVGDYVKGNSMYCRPPSKRYNDPLSPLYDSCVDDTADPSIFVIFENGQVYPEYLVKYQAKQSSFWL